MTVEAGTVGQVQIFPAGTYYVGDLFDIMSEEDQKLLDAAASKDGEPAEGVFKMPDGRQFAIFNTASSAEVQTVEDTQGRKYVIKSGSVGCIRVQPEYREGETQGGQIIKYSNDFICTGEDGLLKFGGVRIDTSS